MPKVQPKKNELLQSMAGGLIVSCQSEPPEPFARPTLLLAMARSALYGGAVAIRANRPRNIRYLLKHLEVPLIGIYKKTYRSSEVFITPTLKEVQALIKTGVPIIALDATFRKRPGQVPLTELLAYIRNRSSCLVVADVSTVQEGVQAARMGFDLISTTLSGYTAYTRDRMHPDQPDFDLIEQLVKEVGPHLPVLAEGRIWQPQQARQCLDLGAFAVVVGTAITRPWVLTERFVQALKDERSC